MSDFIVFQSQKEAVRSGNCPDHLRLGSFWLCKVSLSVAEFTTFSRVYPVYNICFSLKYCSILLQENLFTLFPPSRSLHHCSLLDHVCPTSLVCTERKMGLQTWITLSPPALWHLAACREYKLRVFSWPCDKCGSHIPDLLREFCYSQVCCYQFYNHAWFRGSLLGSLCFP